MKKTISLFLSALAIMVATCVNAQVTTSVMRGQIVDENNDPVVGATIVATHEPSGSTYGAGSNVDGYYTIQGMRTGGPYTVKISYIGYKSEVYQELRLELGTPLVTNANLSPSTEMLDEVVIVGEKNSKSAGGAGQNFSSTDIANAPTVDRSIYDVVKNMPMTTKTKSGGISFAGSNTRYNSFQIDGTVSNDVFGLSSEGTNGAKTGANPISMDAVQEIQVVIAPFDVRQSGFTGGGINAITKQGDNTFRASAYTYYADENFYGTWNASYEEESKLDNQLLQTFGASVSGSIVKDKLFYFVNVENREKVYPVTSYPGAGEKYITEEVAQTVLDKYKEYTGITEVFGPRDVARNSLSVLARVDYNIDDNNKLAVRYQLNDSYDDQYSGSYSSYTFNNSATRIVNKTHSFVAELNSRIGDNFFNEVRASATLVKDDRVNPYNGPCVSISNGFPDFGDNGFGISIGTEYSSGANYLDQKIFTFEDNFSYYAGDHTLTFGTHNEFYNIKNVFIQAAYGAWYFDDVESFLNDTPNKFTYKYTDPSATGGDTRWAPTMNYLQLGLYAQDDWNINRNLNLTYGLRLDMPMSLTLPTVNEKFNLYAYENNIEERVGQNPSTKLMVSPRIGVRWYTNDSHETLIRGGVGLFTGRVPFVWLSNAYTNTGIEQKGVTIETDVPGMTDYSKDPLAGAMTSSTGINPDVVTVSKDFKFPQVLRASAALEQILPYDMKLTIEGIYSKTLNNVFFENLVLSDTGDKFYAVAGVDASSGVSYTKDTPDFNTVINLKNTNKGYSYVLSAKLEKNFDFGLNLMGSYTFSRAKSVNDGTSSVAYSNWKYNYSRNINSDGELGFTKFDTPHSVVLQASYVTPKYANGLMSTEFSVSYTGFSGSRYCLVYNEPSNVINNDGYYGNTLLYIPTADELSKMNFVDKVSSGVVTMTAEESRAAFAEWIENDKYASTHRGQFAERYSNTTPWENQIDLHIAQNITYLKERGSKIQITLDVMNFANMLNKNWGANYSQPYNIAPLAAVSKDSSTGTMSFTYNNSSYYKSDIFSRWRAQIGCRITF